MVNSKKRTKSHDYINTDEGTTKQGDSFNRVSKQHMYNNWMWNLLTPPPCTIVQNKTNFNKKENGGWYIDKCMPR